MNARSLGLLSVLLVVAVLVSVSHATFNYSQCKHIVVGAGIGGLYTAFQFQNTSKYPAGSVCVFEQRNRVGGRIYSYRDAQGRLMFELGGATFSEGLLPIMNSLKKAFNLHTECYNNLSPTCGEDGNYWAYIRGVFNTQDQGYKKSKTFPYVLQKDEKFNKESDYVDPWAINDAQIPLLEELADDLASTDSHVAWTAIKSIFDYMKTEKVPGTNYTFSELDLRHGTYDPETGEKLVFSEEYWRMVLDALGESDSPEWIFHASKYGLNSESILYSIGFSSGDSIFVDSHSNNIGYATPIEILAQKVVQKGGSVFFNHKVTGIKRNSNGKLVVSGVIYNPATERIIDDFAVTVNDATLNMGVLEVKALSGDSVIWREPSFDFAKLIDAYGTSWTAKGYLHYADPWWIRILGMTGDTWRTDEPLRYYENGQTYPDCNVDSFRQGNYCPTWTQAIYLSGQQYTAYWEAINFNRTDVGPIWLSLDDPKTAPFLLEAHNQFVAGLATLLRQHGVNPATIAPPDRIVLSIWPAGWAYIKPNTYPVGYMNKAVRKPIANTPLCIINTDFSCIQGWAEGSLISALEAMVLCHNLQVPEIPQDFYDTIVSSYL